MKKEKKFLIVQIFAIFFAVGIFGFNVEKAAADKCTAAFPDGSFSCIDINNATATKNIFDTSTACQQGYCTGAASVQCCRTTCNSDELCTNVTQGANGKSLVPAGMACVDRGVCGANRACCKPTSGTSGANQNTPANNSGTGTAFTNPLRFESVDEFLTNLLVVMQRIIVTLSLVVIVYGALMYITSAGDDKKMTTGKNAITAACVGLAIGIGAPSMLKEIAGILGWGQTNSETVNSALTLSQIATNVLNFMLGVTGIISLIMLVLGALAYLTSAGDDKQAETGKKIFKYSLYGVIIAMSAMILVTQIAKFFAGSSSTATTTTSTTTTGNITSSNAAPADCPAGDFSCAGNAGYGTVTQASCDKGFPGTAVNKSGTGCCDSGDYACLNK